MIKECVKEVIFEEGVLSSIITEVAQGLQGSAVLRESLSPPNRRSPQVPAANQSGEVDRKSVV